MVMFPVRASFPVVAGTIKGLILIGPELPSVFRGALFEKKLFSLLCQLGVK